MKRLICVLLALVPAITSCASKKEAAPANPYTSTAKPPPKAPFYLQWMQKLVNLIPKKQKPPAAIMPQWTGVIRMVNAAEHFVLIESSALSTAIPGELYLTVDKGVETGSVRMTSLKNPPFLIADIVSGNPAQGEKIYRPTQEAAATPSPTPKPAPAPKPKPTPKPKPSPKPTPTPRQIRVEKPDNRTLKPSTPQAAPSPAQGAPKPVSTPKPTGSPQP